MSTVFLDLVLSDLGLCSSGSKAGVAFCNKGKHFQIATVDGIILEELLSYFVLFMQLSLQW